MECIILAGGFGTRLQSVVSDVPKCMAPINDQPFLHYLLEYLRMQGCKRLIFSLGYKSDIVLNWLNRNSPLPFDYVIEGNPLGTGGGIQLALSKIDHEHAIVVNGDTLFFVDLKELTDLHITQKAETTIALKPLQDFDRYGTVDVNSENQIHNFKEKSYCKEGLINGGVYCINKQMMYNRGLPEKFSFETDYLSKYVDEKKFCGYITDEYFIDIGIPEDYAIAQIDFKRIFK